MKKETIITFVAAVVVFQSASWASTNVAIVNIPAVSERYKRTADLEARFEVRRNELNQQRDQLRAKLERAARSLQEELKPGTDAFESRQKEAALLDAELKFFIESAGRKIEQELAGSLRSIFDDIQSVVEDIAREQGIDVVLAADQMPTGKAGSTIQVRQQIVLQKVLFWSPNLDLTDEVVTRLNAQYAKQRSQPQK